MKCPDCGAGNVTIQIIPEIIQTTHKGVGLIGNINNAARNLTATATLGMSNLFWKESKGSSKTKLHTHKVCLCQNCGHSWELN